MRYHVAEYVYSLPDVYIAKMLSIAASGLNALDDRTPMEEETLMHVLRMERLLQQEERANGKD